MTPVQPNPEEVRRLEQLLLGCEAATDAGQHADGKPQALEAVELARRLDARSHLAHALFLLGVQEFRLGEFEAAMASLQEAVPLFEDLDDQLGLSATLNTLVMVFEDLGLHEEAVAHSEHSLDAAKRSGDTLTLAWAYNRAGIVHGGLGDMSEAVSSLTFALGLAREVGDDEAQFAALNNLCDQLTIFARDQLAAGERADAEANLALAAECAEEGLGLARSAGNHHREAIILLNYAAALAASGEGDRALELLYGSKAISERQGFRPLEFGSRQGIAAAMADRGDLRGAIECYRDLLAEAERGGDGPVEHELHVSLYETYKRAGQYREALEHHERHLALDRHFRSQVAETRARLLWDRLELDNARLEAERARLEATLQRVRNNELEAANVALQRQGMVLKRRAHEDGLTGLWNRHYVDGELPRLIEEARLRVEPLSVALLDADRFKTVNDRWGHLVGDEVLRRIAGILRTHMRPTDLLARIGGEEFLIALPGAPAHAAVALSERLCEAVRKGDWNGLPPGCGATISVGVVTATDGMLPEVDDLLERADAALYRAKEKGRDRVEVAQ